MQKKIPMRQCVGCREMRPKRELVRVVKSPEGEITLDFKGKAPGAGAYVCPNVDCLKKARKAKALDAASTARSHRRSMTHSQNGWRRSMEHNQKRPCTCSASPPRQTVSPSARSPRASPAAAARRGCCSSRRMPGEHTVRRAQSFCRSGKPAWMQVGFTKEELGNGLGCNACALCAVLDPALAKAFVEALGTGEGNEAILQELTRQTMRVQKRRQEEKAHRNNMKYGKK